MMGLDSKLFRSKLAWRFFGLFVICAFLPILIFAALAYTHVAGRLEAQAYERLRGYAKAHGMSLFEHLAVAQGQIQVLGDSWGGAPPGPGRTLETTALRAAQKSRYFDRLGIYRQGSYLALIGPAVSNESILPVTHRLTSGDETTLAVLSSPDGLPKIALVHRLASTEMVDDDPVFFVGVLNSDFLWGLESGTILPEGIHWSVWDQWEGGLFSTLTPEDWGRLDLSAISAETSSIRARVHLDEGDHYAACWSLFLKHHFHAPQWTIMVLAPESDVLAPFYRFQTVFPLVVLLTLAVVVLISSLAIRRSLVPIDLLLQGARQVAQGRFTHRVRVKSRDEFFDLAQTFNRMSDELDKQFKAISARSDVDRAILSLLNTDAIVAKILPNLNLFFPCVAGAITILDADNTSRGMTYSTAFAGESCSLQSRPSQLSIGAQTLLQEHPDGMEIDHVSGSFSFLGDLRIAGTVAWMLMPVLRQKRLVALVCFGLLDAKGYTRKDLAQARQLVQQLAVALSNAQLIHELKDLNMGTLNALARTVDAKSPWTAGHSERVMQMSVQIGRTMGLSEAQLNDMRQAALLHDIGKIGIPNSILDKTAPLTDEEFARIRTHATIGARILEPIAAYRHLIPVVEQHHERYDGKGYPKGLAGDAIHLEARIMAVADAFDAMVSDRPYRNGMPLGKVRGIIREEVGRQFDHKVVAAFERVVAGQYSLEVISGERVVPDEAAPPQKVAQAR